MTEQIDNKSRIKENQLMILSPELITFFSAMLPFLELKLAIPLGIELGLSNTTTFIFATSGSIIPAAIILAIISPLSNYLREKSKKIDQYLTKLFNKTRTDHSKNFNRYGAILLIIIIAIPIPGSGTATGSLIAFIFGIEYWKSLGLISLGAFTSGLLLTAGVNSIHAIVNVFA